MGIRLVLSQINRAEDFIKWSQEKLFFEILAHRGTSGIYLEPITTVSGEQEVLFARGSSILDHKVEKHADGVLYIVVEVMSA